MILLCLLDLIQLLYALTSYCIGLHYSYKVMSAIDTPPSTHDILDVSTYTVIGCVAAMAIDTVHVQ